MEKRASSQRTQSLAINKLEPSDTETLNEIKLLHIRVLGSQSDVDVEACAKVDANEIHYVLNPEGIVIGYMILQVEFDTVNVLAIGVDDRLREKGVGTTLLKPTLEKYRITRLAVAQENKEAIRFYSKLGFIPEAVLVDYYGLEQHGFSMVYSK